MKCSFCKRHADDVPVMVAGPEGHNICIECAKTIAAGMIHKKGSNVAVACSFCGIADGQPHGIGDGGSSIICVRCTIQSLGYMAGIDASSIASATELRQYFNVMGAGEEDYMSN